jgi:hypothetical protein
MAKCKVSGCLETTSGTHCEACRVAFNAAERANGGRRRKHLLNDDRCQNCFLTGHAEEDCDWQASIWARSETREQAAARIGR